MKFEVELIEGGRCIIPKEEKKRTYSKGTRKRRTKAEIQAEKDAKAAGAGA